MSGTSRRKQRFDSPCARQIRYHSG